jgi:outer membrane protein OmpA-like peptidoglycan-associated protein/Mg-chelatase subunit ChlD
VKKTIKCLAYIGYLLIIQAFHHDVNAQLLQAINNDGEILITVDHKGDSNFTVTKKGNYGVEYKNEVAVRNYLFTVYDLSKKAIAQKIKFSVKKKDHPDSLVVAPNGQNFYLKFSNHYFVFNSFSGRLTGNYYYPSAQAIYHLKKRSPQKMKEALNQDVITFPFNDFMYVVRHESMLVYYDAFTGMPIDTCTGFSRNADIKQLFFSKDDNYLVAEDTRKRFYIWKTGIRKILFRTFGDEVTFSSDMQKLFILRKSNNNFHLAVYRLPDLKIIRNIRKNTLQQFYPPPKQKGNRVITYFPGKNTAQKLVTLSTSGSYLLYSFEYDRLSDYYMFINTDSLYLAAHFDEIKSGRRGKNSVWVSDNVVEIRESENISRLYKLPLANKPILLNFSYRSSQNDLGIPISQRRIESPVKVNNLKTFKVYQVKSSSVVASVLSTTAVQYPKSVLVRNFRFIDFSSDGRFAVFMGAQNIPVRVQLTNLFTNKGDIGLDKLTGFGTLSKAVTENWIENDSKPPSTYSYFRFDTIKPIYQIIPGEEIHILQKSIFQEGSTVTLQVHLMDNSGHYYSEAAKDGTKDIWCGLFAQKPDSTIEKIEHFEIVEFSDEEKQKDAIALVLDHSGSMGMQRSLDIEKSARDFIKLKNKDDGIALVKYDDWIGVESYLTSNTKVLLDSLKMYGMRGYGGYTALLDAINTGIFLLKNEYGYNRKAVVLMTDGIENSSRISKNEVLKRALENDISIFTIGFGSKIDSDYLKTLSTRTGGTYYQLYNSRDLRWIFEDIYKKINNYYEIKFDLNTIGVHQIVLKLCYEKAQPLVIEFDNTPLPPIELLDTSDFELKLPVQVMVYDSVVIDEPEFEKIVNELPPIPFDKIRQSWIFNVDTLAIQTEFEYIEFPNIRFEFDKTVIIPGTDKGIENVVGFMNKYPQVNVEIIGHTDSIGSIEYNIDLSVRRAGKVKEMLVKHDIDQDRLITSGRGESQPALANNNYWKRTYNRRVEFRLIFPKY